MSWQPAVFVVLALVLVSGGVWFERSRPSARLLAAVAALAALGVAGRVALAPFPNVVATTDVALLAGYTLGGAPGFAVGSLSALISNFWLGQGPWTPWQMAGWGMVGVGGATLALLTARRLGRWGLAAAAALAGLFYGALLDLSAMVNFGGEQSLDRYLALSARAIPFNVAHAVGNAALMLAAGPALVRMLSRYRERFEINWVEPRAVGAGVAALVLALVISAPLLSTPPGAAAQAGDSGEATFERAQVAGASAGRSWLSAAQNPDGGFGSAEGAVSSPGMTGWAVLGLEAAGRNPLDVARSGKSPIDYLRRNVGDLDSTGDLERTILALEGAGLNSADFGGRDLLAALRKRESGAGSYESQVNLTAFGILARAAAGEEAGELSDSARWLREAQNKDGGWGSTRSAISEADSTGAVLQALAAAGSGRPLGDGADWLASSQRSDGGWPLTKGADSNSQSTAWALQGLAAAGRDPGRVAKKSASGFDFLTARQGSDGHYAYSRASDQTPVWVTAQALTGAGPTPFPIAAVARKPGGGGGGSGSGGTGGGNGNGSGQSGSGGVKAKGGGRSGGNSGGGKGGKNSGGKNSEKGNNAKRKGNKHPGKDAEAELLEAGAESIPAAVPPPAADEDDGGPSTAALIGGGAGIAALLLVGFVGHRRLWW